MPSLPRASLLALLPNGRRVPNKSSRLVSPVAAPNDAASVSAADRRPSVAVRHVLAHIGQVPPRLVARQAPKPSPCLSGVLHTLGLRESLPRPSDAGRRQECSRTLARKGRKAASRTETGVPRPDGIKDSDVRPKTGD